MVGLKDLQCPECGVVMDRVFVTSVYDMVDETDIGRFQVDETKYDGDGELTGYKCPECGLHLNIPDTCKKKYYKVTRTNGEVFRLFEYVG